MSLLDRAGATHTVTVVLRRPTTNERGKTEYAEVGRVLCDGALQPSTQADVERYDGSGMAVQDTMRFIARNFPGDDVSLVEHEGITYRVIGAPRRYRSSPRTARDIVLLSAETQPRRWG